MFFLRCGEEPFLGERSLVLSGHTACALPHAREADWPTIAFSAVDSGEVQLGVSVIWAEV